MSRVENFDYHLGRLLVLLRHFAPSSGGGLKGLTKLAKLDFLLRYPAFTDRILESRNLSWPLGAEPSASEWNAVESRMIRYKYGPWDDRYYPLLGNLVGLGLADVRYRGSNIEVALTEEGEQRARQLAVTEEWLPVDLRAQMLHQNFNTTGNRLKEMIYKELPDVVALPYRAEI